MAKPNMTFVRIEPEIREMIDALGRTWGGIRPAHQSDVIREAIRRAFAAEQKKSQKIRQPVLDKT